MIGKSCTAQVFEYYQDLDYYYKTSYGNSEITSKMPCPLIKDLVDTFEYKENQNDSPSNNNYYV